MTTTDRFQVNPDFYDSKEACVAAKRAGVQTNPRYKHFRQTHFTAADVDQFERYRDPTNGDVGRTVEERKGNVWADTAPPPRVLWSRYSDLGVTPGEGQGPVAVTNTFRYIFHKLKKGIFVKIKNGKLAVFLPFSKKNFTNEWSDRIKIDPRYRGDMTEFVRFIHGLEGRRFNPRRVNKFTESWYGNNCLVRFEYPPNEGDTNHGAISDFLRTLCAERDVPDMEFFINRRDFPILRTDGAEPYTDMWDGLHPLVSHSYTKYAPVLRMVRRKNYADIPMPTGEDWVRISSAEGKYYPKSCREYNESFNAVPWNQRKPTAVFRGGSTGCGVTPETNVRLRLAEMSASQNGQKPPLLDAGITNWNIRPRKIAGEKYLRTIDFRRFSFGLVGRLTPQEQAHYKYLVNVDGHVRAFRLSLELRMGCCILLVDSPYKLWYRDQLIPYEHYVPVKEDLSDLLDQIRWCREHDSECEQIAQNALAFHNQYLSKEGALDYMQHLLLVIKRVTGTYLYNSRRPLVSQLSAECSQLVAGDFDDYPDTEASVSDLDSIPLGGRTYGQLQGVHWLVNFVRDQSEFESVATKHAVLFEGKLSRVDEYKMAGFSFAVKIALDADKSDETIHEAFICLSSINPLCKFTPNLAYTFGLLGGISENVETSNCPLKASLVEERIVGETLSDWIASPRFNIPEYLSVLMQLALTLQIAQKRCGFVHNDLVPQNIMIRRLDRAVEYDYMIGDEETGEGRVYRIRTSIIPVAVDFGKSHVIYKGRHYGYINMYRVSTIQDVISLLVTSLYAITERGAHSQSPHAPWKPTGASSSRVQPPRGNDLKTLISLANFLSGTVYRRRPFKISGKGGLGDLRFFLRNAKKYANLISRDKGVLEGRTPLDFFRVVAGLSAAKGLVRRVPRYENHLDWDNSRQIFEYALRPAPDRLATYTAVFDRILACRLPKARNATTAHYVAQTIHRNASSVMSGLLSYAKMAGVNEARVQAGKESYQTAMERLASSLREFESKVEEREEKFSQGGQGTPPRAPYDAETFSVPGEVLNLLESSQAPPNLSLVENRAREHFLYLRSVTNGGPFALPASLKDSSSVRSILKIDPLYELVDAANALTLRSTALSIARSDLEALEDAEEDSVSTAYSTMYNRIKNLAG